MRMDTRVHSHARKHVRRDVHIHEATSVLTRREGGSEMFDQSALGAARRAALNRVRVGAP